MFHLRIGRTFPTIYVKSLQRPFAKGRILSAMHAYERAFLSPPQLILIKFFGMWKVLRGNCRLRKDFAMALEEGKETKFRRFVLLTSSAGRDDHRPDRISCLAGGTVQVGKRGKQCLSVISSICRKETRLRRGSPAHEGGPGGRRGWID